MNKILLVLVVLLTGVTLISFITKSDETNFNLEENKPIIVKVLKNNNVLTLNLEDYIIGVVAGEMPASFEIEALKAQAVASRSYALYKKNNSDNTYDLTSDTNNQVYLTKEEMKDKWQEDYDYYYNKVKDAVESTKNEVITYNGEIIEAFYFSMSNGQTEDSINVFKEDVEYLKSVDSIYDNENINKFKQEYFFSKDEFVNKFNLNCKIDGIDITYDDSHYVDNLKVCDQIINGIDVRNKLNLRSASFDVEVFDNIKITTYGYGHGVGLSQYGANGYAKEGYNYKDILKHYYTNINISSIK